MKTVIKYYKKYIPLIFLVIAFLFGQAMCELALPGYMSDIINKGIMSGDNTYILKTGGLMLGISFVGMILASSAGFFAARVSAFASRNIRKDLFARVTAFSAEEMEQFGSASLITRATNDVQAIQQSSVMILRFAFFAPIMGVGALVKALSTKPELTWTILLALGVILLIMLCLFLLVIPKFKVLQSKLDKLNLIVSERLTGLLIVRSFNKEAHEEKRFSESNKEVQNINTFINRGMAFMFPSLMFIMNLTSILIIWVGAHMIDTGNLMIGDMLAFMQYGMQIIMSFLLITMSFIMIPRAAVSAGRIGAVLNVKPTIVDKEECTSLVAPKGRIAFNNVSFSYPDAEERTLSDISFVAEPGKTTAIIGGTGSGKSTLVTLISRFFDATEGEVLLDGVNIKDICQSELRDQIGYVPQKGLLFSGTIRSNMEFGKEDATDEEQYAALKTAMALDFVESLDGGLDHQISQGGTSVSGGQKQRLSIARALVKKPKILIFDDSFSALDYKTDQKLRESLKTQTKDTTVIIVAQRINTILDADQIIVMEEGKILGIGSHEELFKDNDIYREIALSQLSEKELGKEAK